MSPEMACQEAKTYVAAGEVTALEHELRDDSVEGRALVAEALLASAESAEVLSSLRDDIVEEVEVDATGLLCSRVRGLVSKWQIVKTREAYASA